MYKGQKVKCKYSENGTGTLLRKISNKGWKVEYKMYKSFQDFKTLKVTSELCTDSCFIKNDDIELID